MKEDEIDINGSYIGRNLLVDEIQVIDIMVCVTPKGEQMVPTGGPHGEIGIGTHKEDLVGSFSRGL
jgi:hypothetical protein